MATAIHHPNGLDDPSKAAPRRPVVARMYDWYLGGSHSYEVDRLAAIEVAQRFPDIIPTAIENRMFLRRAVRWLARNGVTQFIDMGSGLPTAGSTHEAVLEVASNARVLYVDIEESAVEEGKEFIRDTGYEEPVGMIRASALEPESIFVHPEARRVIDFSQPVAIMMFALIHFWSPAQYTAALNYWRTTLVKGSAFVMTHGTEDGRSGEELKGLRGLVDVYEQTPTPVMFRTKEDVAPVMNGWVMVEPGLVRPHSWKTEELAVANEEWPLSRMWWVAVGFLH